MFRELQCSVCGCDLYGDLDTYGEPGAEQCEACHNGLMDYEEYRHMRFARRVIENRPHNENDSEYRWIEVR